MTQRPWILTLVGKPDGLDDLIVHAAANALGRPAAKPDWLSPGRACDLALDDAGSLGDDLKGSIEIARSAMNGAAVDLCLHAAGGRRKRLLVAEWTAPS